MSSKKQNMRSFYNQNEHSRIDAMVKNNNTNLRIATFCIVTKVNGNKINAKPLVAESVQQKDGEIYVSLPELLNVPYLKTGHNPKEGDFCVCITLDRSIRNINKEQDYENPTLTNSNGEIHDLNNCIALVGIEL